MRTPTTYRPIRHPARPRYRVAALARRYAGETASGRVARCQQDARCDLQELSRLLPTPEPAPRRDGTSARERLRALLLAAIEADRANGEVPRGRSVRRQVAELQAELIHLRAVMSGQVKMLPAPPRRQCRTRVGKIPRPKREKPSTSSPPKMVARKIPQPPLRRLPPSRRLRPSALKRGPRSSDSPRTSRSNFSTCGRAEMSRGGRSSTAARAR
jgi:hypothetical protein